MLLFKQKLFDTDMLSLSPRYDLFRFHIPKTFIPEEIEEKYTTVLSKKQGDHIGSATASDPGKARWLLRTLPAGVCHRLENW